MNLEARLKKKLSELTKSNKKNETIIIKHDESNKRLRREYKPHQKRRYIKEFLEDKDNRILHAGILDKTIDDKQKSEMWKLLIFNSESTDIKAKYIIASGIRNKHMLDMLFECDLDFFTLKQLFCVEKIRYFRIFCKIIRIYDEFNSKTEKSDLHFKKSFDESLIKISNKKTLKILKCTDGNHPFIQDVISIELIEKIKLKNLSIVPEYVKMIMLNSIKNKELLLACYRKIKYCMLDMNFINKVFVLDNFQVQKSKMKLLMKFFRLSIYQKEFTFDRFMSQINSMNESKIENQSDSNETNIDFRCFKTATFENKTDFNAVTSNNLLKRMQKFFMKYLNAVSLRKSLLYQFYFTTKNYIKALDQVKNEQSLRKLHALFMISRDSVDVQLKKDGFHDQISLNFKLRVILTELIETGNILPEKREFLRITKPKIENERKYSNLHFHLLKESELTKNTSDFSKTENFSLFYIIYSLEKRKGDFKEASKKLKMYLNKNKDNLLEYEYLFSNGSLGQVKPELLNSFCSRYFAVKKLISDSKNNWELQVINILYDHLQVNGDFFIFFYFALRSLFSKMKEQDFRNLQSGNKDKIQPENEKTVILKVICEHFMVTLSSYLAIGKINGVYFPLLTLSLNEDFLKCLEYAADLMERDRFFEKMT